jgi:hypothetical protein
MPIEDRAKLIARMTRFILNGLKAKTYEQLVESFSNPGRLPNAFEHFSRKVRFQMCVSASCWYNVTASYRHRSAPFATRHRRRVIE